MSKRNRTKSVQEIVPSSQKFDAISDWLQKMLDRFPAKGKLTESEVQDWIRDLTPFSVAAINFAFEKMRLGIFFPMNGQVIDLCLSYDPPEQRVQSTANCDAICRARHGKGYNETDMVWLFGKMQQAYANGDTPNVDALMTELDNRRGGAPEWRKSTT